MSFYDKRTVYVLLENDEINEFEEAFMIGYLAA